MSRTEGSHELSVDIREQGTLSNGASKKNVTQHRAVTFNVSHILVSLLFIWLLLIHLAGLFFFTKGFLLTRLVLEDRSFCGTLPDGSASLNRSDGCWHPRTFKKAVVIVIDALRYDFCVPYQPVNVDDVPKYYHNNLDFLYNTALQQPEKSLLFPFIADPPTSTLQRLKGLTAGNLPTFIDIGSNFAGQAAEEDNLLVQLKSQGKTIVHLGDDTWHSLFPGYFDQNLTHAYDSFNVWDLHTVDNGVIEHIFPLLDVHNDLHWDIIFGHFLGVDHAGHRYGPDHVAMAEKLRQMNTVVERIANGIDDETVLVILGDHGMDSKGDHGGESDDEVESTLWIYAQNPSFGRFHRNEVQPPLTAKDRPVEQIDLVSTLSLLLGLPVPFNNLGSPIPEAFLKNIPATPSDQDNLFKVNKLVLDQILLYQSKYSESREFSEDQALNDIRTRLKTSTDKPSQTNKLFTQWHRQTVHNYRQMWANFDLPDMAVGAGITLAGLLVLVVLAVSTSSFCDNNLPLVLRNTSVGTLVGAIAAIPTSFYRPTIEQITSTTGPIAFAAIGGALVCILTILSELRTSLKVSIPVAWTGISIFFIVSQVAGFASNSYTIHEDTILTFLLGSFAAVCLVSSLRQTHASDRVLGTYHSVLFVLLTRASSFSRLCREEQMPGCRSTFYASQTSSTSAPWQLLMPFLIALILPEIVKAFYRGTASYAGTAGFWIGVCVRTGLLLVAIYWIVDAADNGKWLADRISSTTLKSVSITIARCVLAIAIPIGIGIFIWSKPCIDINLEDVLIPSKPGQLKRQVTILGYANVFGSRYFLIVPSLMLSITLLLPPMGQYSLAICTWQILCLCEILDTNGLIIGEFAQPYIGPIVLAMLGSYHFFKTGHQAVLSSIQWNSAFVPLRTIQYPWSPILIILNNFGPQLLCALAVPLTVLWKRPISKDGLRHYWGDITKACITHLLYYATIQAATTIWAGHLRRHLMLYRVFMPRFLMASGVLIVVDIVLIIGALLAARVTGSSVAEIFGY